MARKILWLCPPNFSGALLSIAQKAIKRVGLDLRDIEFAELTRGCIIQKTKTKKIANPAKAPAFYAALAKKQYQIIVCNDSAALFYLTNKYMSLSQCRGGVYIYNEKPVLVLDDVRKTKSTREGEFIAMQDMRKLERWVNGKQRPEPKFQLQICETIADVNAVLETVQNSILCAIDIETSGTLISCIGYSCWTREGTNKTFVIPFYNPTKPNGYHWDTHEDEVNVWETVKLIHASSTYKVMQNGSYDSTYFIVYGIPLFNYLFDTLHMWHATWPELPKRLDFITSILVDSYRYWKDEGKDEDTKGYAVPMTPQGIANYWLYNGLDCYATLLDCRVIVQILMQAEWAKTNYVKKFSAQFRELISMSMRGVKVNQQIHQQLIEDMWEEHVKAKADLLLSVADPDFNPNSSQQVQALLYDLLQVNEVPRKGRSSDEVVLKMIAAEDVLASAIINQIWATKKPANNVSKYQDGCLLNGRFMYKLYAAGTPTDRLSSKAHDLWVGSNIQNVPRRMRVMFEADPGMILVEMDYAQSDAYFTAFESGDPAFIATMTSGMDTHCIHASRFFKVDYNKILEATKANEDWAVHPTKGIRQNTKRVVYGSNYFMHAFTLLMTMGREAVVESAKFLGFEEANTWSLMKLADFCDKYLLQVYYQMYPEIKLSIPEKAMKAVRNGNRATTAFGYTRQFFGDLINDEKLQREFAAFFGQGGTAGNINKAMDTIFTNLEPKGVELLTQVHDSLLFQIPETELHLIDEVQKAMENEITIEGRTFVVPTDAKVGRGWGKRMIAWKPGVTTLADIDKAENVWQEKWAKEHSK